MDGAIGLGIGLNGPQREGVVALGKFERDAGDGRGGAMLDGERDAIVGVAAEVEVGIAPAWNSDEPRRAWPARTVPAPFLA